MPIKIVGTSPSPKSETGIYQDWEYNPRSAGDLFEAFRAAFPDFETLLGNVEKYATQVLQAATGGPELKKDAGDVLLEVAAVRKFAEQGRVKDVGVESFRLGRHVERMLVRAHEPNARTGKQVRSGGRKGSTSAHVDKPGKWASYKQILYTYMNDHPRIPYSVCCKRVARTLHISERTIRTHAPNPHPKAKK